MGREIAKDLSLVCDGKQLRDLRKDAGFTQEELAEKLDISRETVVAIENNHKQTIEALALKKVVEWRIACESKAGSMTIAKFTSHLKKVLKLS